MTCPRCNRPKKRDPRYPTTRECALCHAELGWWIRRQLEALREGGMTLKAAAFEIGIGFKNAQYHWGRRRYDL